MKHIYIYNTQYYKPSNQYTTQNYNEQTNTIGGNNTFNEKAGFRKNRRTVEQILNCRLLWKKHIDQHRPLYHNFIYFNISYFRVWHGMFHGMP